MIYIESKRKVIDVYFHQIVYEWEDTLLKCLSGKLRNKSITLFHAFAKRFPLLRFNYKIPRKNIIFRFDMNVLNLEHKDCRNTKNVYPAIIDFTLLKSDFDEFYRWYKDYDNVLVSSLEIVEKLKECGCPLKITHFPLSISDKYAFNAKVLEEKEYDVVFAGNVSKVFQDFLEKYKQSHPSLKVLYRRRKGNKFEYYDDQGNTSVDYDDTRESYMRYLRKSRVAFYSTPGRDRKAECGYNWVTPRFLEILCSGCAVIMQYNSTADTQYYELESLWGKSVESYEEFEKAMDNALSTPIDVEKYSNYLAKHYTSTRANLFLEILKKDNKI